MSKKSKSSLLSFSVTLAYSEVQNDFAHLLSNKQIRITGGLKNQTAQIRGTV